MFWLLTAHGFFGIGRAFIGVMLTVYLLQHDISLTTIAWAQSLQLFTSVLFNYPAGRIADKYGKKTAVMLSCLCSVIYFGLMLHPQTEWVIVGEIFNGLSIAAYMGAYEAWIFEFQSEKENRFSLVSRSGEITFLVSLVASILGAMYFDWALYLGLIFACLAIPLFYVSPQRARASLPPASRFDQVIRYFFQRLDRRAIFTIIFIGSLQLIYQFWAVFFSQDIGIETPYLGYVLGSIFAVQWLFVWSSRKIAFNQKSYAVSVGFAGVSASAILTLLFFQWQVSPLWIGASFILLSGFCGLTSNLFFSQSCQLFADHANESSLISLLDTSIRLFGGLLLGLYGLLGIQQAVWIWGIFPIVIGGYLLVTRRDGSG